MLADEGCANERGKPCWRKHHWGSDDGGVVKAFCFSQSERKVHDSANTPTKLKKPQTGFTCHLKP
jgi:hypothetical protein